MPHACCPFHVESITSKHPFTWTYALCQRVCGPTSRKRAWPQPAGPPPPAPHSCTPRPPATAPGTAPGWPPALAGRGRGPWALENECRPVCSLAKPQLHSTALTVQLHSPSQTPITIMVTHHGPSKKAMQNLCFVRVFAASFCTFCKSAKKNSKKSNKNTKHKLW